MHTLFHKITAAMLSAVMLCGMTQPLLTASAAEAEASAEESFRAMIYDAWENKKTNVILSGLKLTVDQVTELYYDMLYTDAKWFYISSAYRYSMDIWQRNYVGAISIEYNYSLDAIPEMQTQFDAAVDAVLSGVQSGWTDAEKVLYLHDYLAEHCEYDLTYKNNNAYTALIDGKTVCQGYALAMCVLCRKLNIPCYAITSDALKHMWNVVQIDGKWYHCDATYDDGAPDMLGHGTHMYLLVSDAYMQADTYHQADDWNYFAENNTITCTADDYAQAFWVGAMDTVHPLPDGSWYYAKAVDPTTVRFADQVTATFSRSRLMNETETFGKVKAAWPTANGNVYSICYVSTQISGDTVYYHDASSIYKRPLTGGDSEKLYTLTAEEKALGSIYGIRFDADGNLTYQIMAAPAFASADQPEMDVTFRTLELTHQQPETTTTTTTTSSSTTTTTSTTTTSKTSKTTTTTTKHTTTTTRPTTTSTSRTTSQTASDTTVTSTTSTSRTRPVFTFPTFPTTTKRSTATTTRTTGTTTKPVTTTTTVTTARTTSAATTTTTRVTVTTTPATTSKTTTKPTTTKTTTTTTVTTTTVTTLPKQGLRGDVNLDGTVDVSDAVLLARFVAEDPNVRIQSQGIANGRCNGDDLLDGDDVIYILRIIARLV